MRYIPKYEDDDDEDDWFTPRFRSNELPTAETTKFSRWGTQIEKDDITPREFIERHPNHVRMINKWLPLGNYRRNSAQKNIERIRRYEVSLFEAAGLSYDAEEVTLDTIGDAQYSRGEEGFYTKEFNTTRQKVKDETERPKQKRINFFKHKEPAPEE